MVFDKYVEIEFGGKVHKMDYPIKCVFEAERHLTDGNLMVMVTKASTGVPPTVYDMFVIIKYAFMGGDPKLTEDVWHDSILCLIPHTVPITRIVIKIYALIIIEQNTQNP